MEKSYHSFLNALKGKTVTIYKGGPESKQGKLLDVKNDYITLYAQNNNNNNNNNNSNNNNNQNQNNNNNKVVYYQAQHVKSIIEDSVSNSKQTVEEDQEEIEYFEAENFVDLIEKLTQETVQINQGGPESTYGSLLGVAGDFLVLYTEDDGLVYENIQHVKSISKYNQNNQDNQNGGNSQTQQTQQIPEPVIAESFHDVFKHFSHQWVSINRGGPEAMEGVLVENAGGHYTLINNQEVMRIHPYHIKSISGGPKGYLKQNNQNNNNEDDNNNNQNENSSEKNQKEESSSSESSDQKRNKKSHSRTRERIVKTIDYKWKY